MRTHSPFSHARLLVMLAAAPMLAAQAQNNAPVSVIHPAGTAQTAQAIEPAGPLAVSAFGPQRGAAPSLVAQGGDWTVLSALVNQISYVATWGNEVWLGTNLGVKLLDRRNATVRHFTQSEGLPTARILAIAAEREAVWCMARPSQPYNADISLCRYDRAQGRWQVLGSLPAAAVSPYSAGNSTIAPLERAALAVTPNFVVFARSPVAAGNRAPFVMWDKRRGRFQDVAWPPELQQAAPFLNVAFVIADGDALWLGGSAGLLRFEPHRDRWQRFLPLRNVLAGGRAPNGDFWLAAVPLDAPRPAPDPARDFGAEPGTPWLLLRFEPRAGRAQEFAAPAVAPAAPGGFASSEPERPGLNLPLGVTPSDGKIWVTAWPRERGSQSRANFYRLDTATSGWIGFTPQRAQDLDIVPDAVLLQPVRQSSPFPPQVLLMALAPRRFPGWLCPPAPVPEAVTNSGPWRTSRHIEEDGATWTVRGNTVLVRSGGNAPEETFPLPPPEAFARFAPPRDPQNADEAPAAPDGFLASKNEFGRDVQLAADAGAIWAWRQGRSAKRLFIARFDRATREWSVRGDEGLPENKYVSQIWSDGDGLWAIVAQVLYHLEPATGRWTNPLSAFLGDARIQNYSVADVLPDGPFVWILTGGLSGWVGSEPHLPLLVRFDKASGRLEPFTPEGFSSLHGTSLLKLRDGLLITSWQGVFRFEPEAARWQRLDVLPQFRLLAELGPSRAVRAEGAIWFVCNDGLVRWTGAQ